MTTSKFILIAFFIYCIGIQSCGGSAAKTEDTPELAPDTKTEEATTTEVTDAESKENSLVSNDERKSEITPPAPLNEQAQQIVETIDGNWKSECVVFEYQGMQDSIFSDMSIGKDGTLKMSIHHFRDEQCEGVHWQDTEILSYVVDGDETTEPAGATSVNYTLQSLTLIPRDLKNTLGMKRAEFCGETNWKRNTSYDLTGRTCSYTLNEITKTISFPSKGSVKEDIYKIENGILRFGLEINQIENGLSSERPKEFNDLKFHKQN